MTETCHVENGAELITHVVLSEACGSNAGETLPVIEELVERGQQPAEPIADASCGSAGNAIEAESMGDRIGESGERGAAIRLEQGSKRRTRR